MVLSHVLVVLQDIAILMMMPIFMATAIAEERESGTLEAMFLSRLGDRDIVLSKFMGRLAHLSVLVLATANLTFLHLWGNVPIWFFLFRQSYAVVLMFAAGSVCINQSAMSPTSRQSCPRTFSILVRPRRNICRNRTVDGNEPWRWNTWFTPVLAAVAIGLGVLAIIKSPRDSTSRGLKAVQQETDTDQFRHDA